MNLGIHRMCRIAPPAVLCVGLILVWPTCCDADDRQDAIVPAGDGGTETGERWALLIGINRYEHLPSLEYCSRDMEALRDILIAFGGYQADHIQLLGDATEGGFRPTRSNIFIELTTFLQQAEPRDTVLVAFAGHGACDKSRKSFLVPIDGNTSETLLPLTCVPMTDVYQFLEACSARQKVVILDCCHSGGERGGRGSTDADFVPGIELPASGLIELLSCGQDEVSHEDDEFRQGVFSYYLARGLEGDADVHVSGNRDGQISVDEAYAFVHDRVTQFIGEKYPGRRQVPIKRGQVEGSIILASRTQARDGLPVERILERLEQRLQERTVSADLVESARRWLSAADSFPPVREMQLLLSLMVQDLITERQFQSLEGGRGAQIDSHLAASTRFSNRRMRAVCVGINSYPGFVRRQLRFATADAVLLAETLSRGAPAGNAGEGDIVVLTDEQASAAAIRDAIESQTAACTADDILFITLSGQSVSGHVDADGRVLRPLNQVAGELRSYLTSDGVTVSEQDVDVRSIGYFLANDARGDAFLGVDGEDGYITVDELDDWVSGCAGHVVILTDADDVEPFSRIEVLPGVFQDEHARLAIGCDGAIESRRISYGRLSFIVAQALAGLADQYTPQPVEFGQLREPRLPDGYVTLVELQTFLTELDRNPELSRQLVESSSELRLELRGHAGPPDVVLTRSNLVVD